MYTYSVCHSSLVPAVTSILAMMLQQNNVGKMYKFEPSKLIWPKF
jgi:hypothetical protein